MVADDACPWEDYSDLKRPKVGFVHRIGPAPKQEWQMAKEGTKSGVTDHIGNLDSSDILGVGVLEEQEDIGEGNNTLEWKRSLKNNVSASSRALVLYFTRMASEDNNEKMDYRFLDALLKNGGSVNVTDKYGQTVMHEVARNWNPDVAKFLISWGADPNKPDKWGRTPLHLAAATNHADMVDFLMNNGANAYEKTHGEKQQVMHYAAKFNSVQTLKVLIDHKVRYTTRDFKGRTPLFLAAEMARAEAVRFFLDIGDRVGVFDDTGMSAIAVMIEKMPQIAYDALDQFQITDYGKRKEHFFLNYLESNPITWWKERRQQSIPDSDEDIPTKFELRQQQRAKCPTSALEIAVKHNELKVIMHPAMQELIKTKWRLFGRLGASGAFVFHFVYILLWTLLAITLPRDGGYYTKHNYRLYWRLPVEVISVLMTFYFILMEIWTSKITYRNTQTFYSWRKRQIHRDLEYCHPRWAQEKTFLEAELKSLSSEGGNSLFTASRLLEYFTYISILVMIGTRVAYMYTTTVSTNDIHKRVMTFSLILIYLHFLKSCRPFPTLGIFITMMSYCIQETFNFMGFFLIITIPYTIGFWMIFAGEVDESNPVHAQLEIEAASNPNGQANVGWVYFHDIMFFSWQVTLNVFFDKRTVMMDRLMAQLMIGSFYFASTLLLFNMYIGLLTETFYKVYDNANAYASIEQATTILNIETMLSQDKKNKVADYIHENCEPACADMDEDEAGTSDEELWEQTIRNIFRRFEHFMEKITGADKPVKKPTIEELEIERYKQEKMDWELYSGVLARDQELHTLRMDMYELKCTVLRLLDPDGSLPPKPLHAPLPSVPPIPEPQLPACLKKKMVKKSPVKTVEIPSEEDESPSRQLDPDNPNQNRVSIDPETAYSGDEMQYNSDGDNGEDYDGDHNYDGDHLVDDVEYDEPFNEEPGPSTANPMDEPELLDSDNASDRSSEYVLNEDLSEQLNWIYPEDYYKGLLAIIEGTCPSVTSQDRERFIGGLSQLSVDGIPGLSLIPGQQFQPPLDNSDQWASSPNLTTPRDHTFSLGDSSAFPSMTSLHSVPSAFQSTSSLQSVPSAFQSTQSLTTEPSDQNLAVQREDNALFRTIMNLKNSNIRHQMQPRTQSLHRILSMINEEDSVRDGQDKEGTGYKDEGKSE